MKKWINKDHFVYFLKLITYFSMVFKIRENIFKLNCLIKAHKSNAFSQSVFILNAKKLKFNFIFGSEEVFDICYSYY